MDLAARHDQVDPVEDRRAAAADACVQVSDLELVLAHASPLLRLLTGSAVAAWRWG